MGIAGNLYVLVSGRYNDTHTYPKTLFRAIGDAESPPSIHLYAIQEVVKPSHEDIIVHAELTGVGHQDWIQDVVSLRGRPTGVHFPEAIDSTTSVSHQLHPPKSRCPETRLSDISAVLTGNAHRPVRLTLGPAGWCRETYPSAWSPPRL
jgi:hypothetical protein